MEFLHSNHEECCVVAHLAIEPNMLKLNKQCDHSCYQFSKNSHHHFYQSLIIVILQKINSFLKNPNGLEKIPILYHHMCDHSFFIKIMCQRFCVKVLHEKSSNLSLTILIVFITTFHNVYSSIIFLLLLTTIFVSHKYVRTFPTNSQTSFLSWPCNFHPNFIVTKIHIHLFSLVT